VQTEGFIGELSGVVLDPLAGHAEIDLAVPGVRRAIPLALDLRRAVADVDARHIAAVGAETGAQILDEAGPEPVAAVVLIGGIERTAGEGVRALSVDAGDLIRIEGVRAERLERNRVGSVEAKESVKAAQPVVITVGLAVGVEAEERRVGKEC